LSAPSPIAPKPTLFLSYASEDRTAVRQLRDALTTAGLDVWYDENELGGGDAWDAKIRRQIRECDYFMPVISANTDRRKEGYFRREWRLAVERTLDMADDVMFLLPVVLDGTNECTARVPEKFLAVQWLRAPGGAPTPALEALARRLAAGEHLAPPAPRGRTEPPISRAAPSPAAAPATGDGPPQMPPFPHQHGAGFAALLKFLAEVLWWLVTAAWLLLRRLPRWARILVILWVILSVTGMCSRSDTSGEAKRASAKKKNDPAQVAAELAEAKQALKDSGLPEFLTKLGTEAATHWAEEMKKSAATEKQLVALSFEGTLAEGAPDAALVDGIFDAAWDRISAARPTGTGLLSTPLPAPSDAALVAIAQKTHAAHIFGARVPEGEPRQLIVVLLRASDGAVVWTATYPLAGAEPTALGAKIADGVLAAVPPS
jgi:hypothetical protein